MNTISVIQNASKYIARQSKDIIKYGEKPVTRSANVQDEILAIFTPFRRLSKKPCTLSDNKYFIDKFEKTTQQELPIVDNWDKLSVEEKIDYIVKGRYRRLLANKIMNAIKNQPVEHNFMLSENGEILAHNIGEKTCVDITTALKLNEKLVEKRVALEEANPKFAHIEAEVGTTTIHNHPRIYETVTEKLDSKSKKVFKEVFDLKPSKEVNPVSCDDILSDIEHLTDGYVVDCRGHKFHFVPKQYNIETVEQYKVFDSKLKKFEKMAFDIFDKYETILEKEKEKLNKMVSSGKYSYEQIQEQQMMLIKAYADSLKQRLTYEDYINILQSDFVKNNLGYYKQIK